MVRPERADRVAAAVNRQAARLKNHRIGHCPACGRPVYRCDRPMRLHAETFHRECARYLSAPVEN